MDGVSCDLHDRRYTRGGRVAHLVRVEAAQGRALCRRQPDGFEDWRGTGDQVEYERAAALPLCRRCDASVRGVCHRGRH